MKVKILSALVIAIIFVSGCAQLPPGPTPSDGPKSELSSVKKFSSLQEAKDFIKKNSEASGYGGLRGGIQTMGGAPMMAETLSDSRASQTLPDFSKTNIQVEGVDEADIVKTDGKYIYTVSGRKKLIIVEAYPATSAKNISTIEINGSISEIFVNKDKLIVFGTEYIEEKGVESEPASEHMIMPYPYRSTVRKDFLSVYDIADRSNPVLKRKTSFNGNYFDSRMIGNMVYFVVNNHVYGDNVIIPMETSTGGIEKCIGVKGGCSVPTDIYYIDQPSSSYMFTLVGALNLEKESYEPSGKTFLMPYTEEMFVSLDNIYITHMKFQTLESQFDELVNEVIIPALTFGKAAEVKAIHDSNLTMAEKAQKIAEALPEVFAGSAWVQYVPDDEYNKMSEESKSILKKMKELAVEVAKKWEKTVVYRISIKGEEINLVAKGELPGHLLNQFSMDEFNGNFRAATTTGNVWEKTSKNHVYVLDGDLKITGKVEDLAPGEKIYSVRFLGERGYVVTFKKVDPLFVIDLKDPVNPKVLGKLKIPGYSDYLHPYDQNHIIGIGKNTIEASEELKNQRDLDFAWYQGVKLALFDVSDPENPKELSKYIIGDRGTDSLALQDHKAFLFSREKNLLVIPVLLAEIKDKTEKPSDEWPQQGDYTFQGAYVFELTKENGFVLKGRITHAEDQESFKKSGYYYSGSGDSVQRSLYIGDVLYTISDSFVKANNLSDLQEVASVKLPYEKQQNYYDDIGPII